MRHTSTKGRTKRRSVILFVAGEGGHIEQARRLSAHVTTENTEKLSRVLLTDHSRDHDAAFDDVVSVPTCAPKHRSVRVSDLLKYWVALIAVLFRLVRTYNVRAVIVTGPGFALYPALMFRLIGSRLIVFESWSRFEKRSKCGKALYPFAHHFLVQHEELLKLYPKAVWTGLL